MLIVTFTLSIKSISIYPRFGLRLGRAMDNLRRWKLNSFIGQLGFLTDASQHSMAFCFCLWRSTESLPIWLSTLTPEIFFLRQQLLIKWHVIICELLNLYCWTQFFHGKRLIFFSLVIVRWRAWGCTEAIVQLWRVLAIAWVHVGLLEYNLFNNSVNVCGLLRCV